MGTKEADQVIASYLIELGWKVTEAYEYGTDKVAEVTISHKAHKSYSAPGLRLALKLMLNDLPLAPNLAKAEKAELEIVPNPVPEVTAEPEPELGDCDKCGGTGRRKRSGHYFPCHDCDGGWVS